MDKWECKKCGACCELIMPNCRNYNSENKNCMDFNNRPYPCRQHNVLDNNFYIETCNLVRKLNEWRKETSDSKRVNRVVWLLLNSYWGASKTQIQKLKDLAILDKDEIEKSILDCGYAFLEGAKNE